MTKNENRNRKPVIVAAVAASFLMLISGLGYRALAARLAAPPDTTPIDPAALEQLPLQIGTWTGQEKPLDEVVVRAADTDAYISRTYSRRNDWESVWLYVAYGVRARDLMPHRPEVCYTGSGWTLVDRRSVERPLSDGTKLPCNVLEFSRGALNTTKIMVLDYYIVDGEYCRDVSLLRSKAWRGSGKVDHVAQVQIVASITTALSTESAASIVSDFAVESASSISGLFDNAERDQRSQKDRSDANRVFGGTESG